MTSLDTAVSLAGRRLPPVPRVLAPAVVAGWGSAVPATRLTNHDLPAHLDTDDEWITSRTGIRERRVAVDGETTLPLALAAARAALGRARVDASAVDLVVVATCTAELPMPSTAAQVATALGTTAGAFDVDAACAGFVSALASGTSMLAAGLARRVLVVGADTMSRVVDPNDRSTAVLFGDGAGAVLLADPDLDIDLDRRGTPGGLVAADLVVGAGDGAELLHIPAGGSRTPASAATVASGGHHLRMDGRELFRRVVREVVDSVERTLDRAGVGPADVAWFLPHQANVRIVDAVVSRLGLDPTHVVGNGDRYGNTSAGSIPLALAEAADAGRFRRGDLVLLSGFGAGLTVSTVLWRWS